MSFLEVMDIVLVVLCVVGYGLQVYFKVKGNVVLTVSELIALAEQSGLNGREKMAQVVAELYTQVPAPLKKVLSKEHLEHIAQKIFDWMRRYAETYAEVTAASASEEAREENMKEAVEALNKEAIADLVSELLGMSLAAMKTEAASRGIETDGLRTKDDYARALVAAALAPKA